MRETEMPGRNSEENGDAGFCQRNAGISPVADRSVTYHCKIYQEHLISQKRQEKAIVPLLTK